MSTGSSFSNKDSQTLQEPAEHLLLGRREACFKQTLNHFPSNSNIFSSKQIWVLIDKSLNPYLLQRFNAALMKIYNILIYVFFDNIKVKRLHCYPPSHLPVLERVIVFPLRLLAT